MYMPWLKRGGYLVRVQRGSNKAGPPYPTSALLVTTVEPTHYPGL